MSVKAKLAVAATAVAAAALPFQVGVAHASTPDDDLTACISTAVATMSPTFSDDVSACVNAYLVELGIDPSTMTFDGSTITLPDGTTDSAVNTAILGTADSNTSVTTASSGAS
ncbi:MAG TPA: hypothetical protein VHT97_08970 [Acidimicrobiales bacterium]|jgi:hypothetical protein|nr:hypothetical protein [Acidimicrobiales bacterium]